MMISNTTKRPQDQNQIIDLSMIKKVMKILSVLLITLTIFYFTCFGSFLVLNDAVAQTVTLSSEGAAAEGWIPNPTKKYYHYCNSCNI